MKTYPAPTIAEMFVTYRSVVYRGDQLCAEQHKELERAFYGGWAAALMNMNAVASAVASGNGTGAAEQMERWREEIVNYGYVKK